MGHNVDYFVFLVHWEDRVQEVAGVVQYKQQQQDFVISEPQYKIDFHLFPCVKGLIEMTLMCCFSHFSIKSQ